MEKMRKALAILSVAVSSYYLFWRSGTLNPHAVLFSAILYGAEIYGFLSLLVFYFMVWRPTDRQSIPPENGLSVDVFIPTLNEDVSLLRKTVLGCKKMEYPHRTILLDDGNRPEVKTLCDELKCVYLARITHPDAKAGNLNFGLTHSNADFIAIFDADHVPQPDFLTKLLGYFKDEKVAFVQTPQDYYNLDSFQHTRKNRTWTDQSIFYSLILPGRDRWNAAFFCGSCAVLRRKALDDIGGFATETVTEDMHTSIKLHAKGWKSVYHRESLAYGLAAQELRPFHNQWLRWGIGTMQVFVKDNPLFIKGLTLPQRICYMSTITFYLDGFQKFIYYISPAIVLFTGVFPIMTNNLGLMIRFVPHLGLSLLAYEEMSQGYGKIFLIEQHNMTRFYVFMKSTLGLLKKKIAFSVTPKSGSEAVSPKSLKPQIFVLSGNILAVLWTVSFAPYKLAQSFVIINIFWALFNSGLAFLVIKHSLKKIQRRKDFRFPAKIVALIDSENESTALAIVEDIHEKGISLNSSAQLDPKKKIELTFLFPGKPVSVSGRVLNADNFSTGTVCSYFYRIVFDDVADAAQDKIIEFSFSYALNKMMCEFGIDRDTPLEKIGKVLERKKELILRKPRYNVQLAGFYHPKSSDETFPFITEDINETGMRLATYSRMDPGAADFDIFLPEDKLPVKGTIMWGKDIGPKACKVWRYGVRFDEESINIIKEKTVLIAQLSACAGRRRGKGR